MTVNYGLRYDHMDAFVEADQWSPRFGLVYKVIPETTLHAAYARDFTPPPTELVSTSTLTKFSGTSAAQSGLNSPVKPERSHYFDVGATQKIGSGLSLGVDGFYKIVTDLIDEGQFGQALIFTPFNYSQGRIYGVELTGNYRQDDFTAYANLARTVSLAKNVESGQFEFGQDELNYIASHWVHTDHDQPIPLLPASPIAGGHALQLRCHFRNRLTERICQYDSSCRPTSSSISGRNASLISGVWAP